MAGKIPGAFYTRPNSPFIWYKVYIGLPNPVRFSTGETSKANAERNKRQYHDRAITIADEIKADSIRLTAATLRTFGEARDLYFDRKGKFLNGGGLGADNERRALDWLEKHIGCERPLTTIDDDLVSELVARRRGDDVISGRTVRGKPRVVKGKKVSHATVNRSVLEPLRRLMLFATDVGKAPMEKIIWKKHRLSEPKERVREISIEEQIKLIDNLRDDYMAITQVAILIGPRRSELIALLWDDIQWGNSRIVIRNGKGAHSGDETIPMPPAVREILWSLYSDPIRHHDHVFSFVAKRDNPNLGYIRGQRYPFTREGFKTAFRRAVDKVGIKDLHFHDTRHTAGSRLHREIGLRGVQTVLRHKDVSTTQKYTHVQDNELIAALQRAADQALEKTESLQDTGTQDGTQIRHTTKSSG